MKLIGLAVACCCVVLTACSSEAAEQPACRYRLVQRVGSTADTAAAAAALPRALAAAGRVDLLLAVGDGLAFAAAAELAANAADQPLLLAVAIDSEVARELLAARKLAAAVAPAALAAPAVELALLRCYGHEVPSLMLLGPQLLTPHNLAAGGELLPAPADFQLAALRHQHAASLSMLPPSDVVFRFGVSLQGSDTGTSSLLAGLSAALARYRQIDATTDRAADGADQVAALNRFCAENFNAILISDAGPEVVAACAKAVEQGIMVVEFGRNLPPQACSLQVDTDQAQYGRAVGQLLGELLPDGGRLLALESRSAQLDWNAFAAALGSDLCR